MNCPVQVKVPKILTYYIGYITRALITFGKLNYRAMDMEATEDHFLSKKHFQDIPNKKRQTKGLRFCYPTQCKVPSEKQVSHMSL